MIERALREQVADYARRLHARGWVANHDGNVSARAGNGRLVITPTATSKAAVTNEPLVVVDERGEKVGGGGQGTRPPAELGLHVTVYSRRSDVHAVVHAHPPYATALACAGSRLLERPFMAEAVVSLGPSVPTVPFAAPGRDACAALATFVAAYDAVLLGSHGVLAWGADVEQAYLRVELVEHLARIAVEAERVGGVRPLPESVLPALLEARRKAGLGAAASATNATNVAANVANAPRPVVACAPSPDANVAIVPPGRAAAAPSAHAPDVATIIREELARALRER
jgi:L-fuculose-phosphate aldolase